MPGGGVQVLVAPMPYEVTTIVFAKAGATLGVACEVTEPVSLCPSSFSITGSAPEKAMMPPAAPVWPAENVQS